MEITAAEQDIFDAEIIRESLSVFSEVFDHLSPDEKYDLLHLLIKKITYYEDRDQGPDGRKSGKMKLDAKLPELSTSVGSFVQS